MPTDPAQMHAGKCERCAVGMALLFCGCNVGVSMWI